jgi:RNA polymerase-binding transcription factor DksA
MHEENFIEEMKSRLLQEKKRLEAELGVLREAPPEYGRSDEDNATEVADLEAQSGTQVAIEARQKEVELALEKIERGTYGVTAEGEKIPLERLRANPAATTLVK